MAANVVVNFGRFKIYQATRFAIFMAQQAKGIGYGGGVIASVEIEAKAGVLRGPDIGVCDLISSALSCVSAVLSF